MVRLGDALEHLLRLLLLVPLVLVRVPPHHRQAEFGQWRVCVPAVGAEWGEKVLFFDPRGQPSPKGDGGGWGDQFFGGQFEVQKIQWCTEKNNYILYNHILFNIIQKIIRYSNKKIGKWKPPLWGVPLTPPPGDGTHLSSPPPRSPGFPSNAPPKASKHPMGGCWPHTLKQPDCQLAVRLLDVLRAGILLDPKDGRGLLYLFEDPRGQGGITVGLFT